MVVCKFFLQGNCRFGETCRNEHPRNQPAQNRFAPLQNGGRGRSGAFGQDTPKTEQYGVTTDEIRLDFTHINHDGNRPLWPLSCYAPGKNAPRQLVEGPLEISPEEMRVQCYLARANGKGDEYINQEAQLINQSQQQAQTILNGLEAAKDYVIDGQNAHPNRRDMEITPTQNFPWINKPGLLQQSPSQPSTGAFGQPSGFGASGANSTGGFGQPSSLGAPKPAFGAPTPVGQASPFGQSSALGGGGPAFGKTAQMGASGVFGQASKLGAGGSPFGQTPAGSTPFGGAQKPAPFGQTSQPGQSSQPAFGSSGFASAAAKPAFDAPTPSTGAFGQPAQAASPFGQPAQATSPFGQSSQPSQPSQPSAFGGTQTAASQFGQAGALGSKPSPFATAAQNTPQTGNPAFGAPSAFGAAKPSPFAAAASQPATSSPFGAPSQPPASSPFAASNQPTSTPAFGAPTQPTAASTGFGAAPKPISGFGASSTSSGGFGAAPSNTTGGFGTAPASVPSGFGTAASQTAPKSMPTTWNGHRVLQEGGLTYYEVPNTEAKDRNATKKVRIWFPTGPPEAKDASYAEAASPDVYEGQLGATLKSLYEFVATNKAFKDGIMPEIPPKREWIAWDF